MNLRMAAITVLATLCMGACTETVVRSRSLIPPPPQEPAVKSTELEALQTEIAEIRAECAEQESRQELLQALFLTRLDYLEALGEYQNAGLTIIVKGDQMTEAEEQVLFTGLSKRSKAMREALDEYAELLTITAESIHSTDRALARRLVRDRERLKSSSFGSLEEKPQGKKTPPVP